jgi:ribosomal protein S18 acetylase RimI-like enzyme
MLIRPLTTFDEARFAEIARGYVSTQRYGVYKEETDARTTFSIVLEDLEVPYVKRWAEDPLDYSKYRMVVTEQGLSLGAYEDDLLIGVGIAEQRDWNRSLWVWEFHVHEDYRGRGIGRQLMDALADTARHAGLHTLVCETQNTNVPAIRFYRRVGFELDGIDTSLYPPEIDEVAFFMKRQVSDPST